LHFQIDCTPNASLQGQSATLALTGPIRIGKSHLCRQIAKRSGRSHVSLDELTMNFGKFGSQLVHDFCFRSAVHGIGRIPDHGVCIDSVLLQHLWLPGSRRTTPTDHVLRANLESRVVLVTSRATVAERLDALQSYRATGNCWTLNTHDDAELPLLAKNIVNRCSKIAQFGAAEGLALAWVDPLNFEQSIASEAERLIALFRRDGK
jgi:hypothetical protein